MSHLFIYNKKPLYHALAVLVVLLSGLFVIVTLLDFSNMDLEGLLFMVTLLFCLFIAKNTFDTVVADEETLQLKDTIADDLAVSSKELHSQIYKNSPVPYMVIDYDGHIRSANIASTRMLGLSQKKIIGVNIFNRLQCEELEHFDLLIEKYRKGISLGDEMVKVKRSDHHEAWALLSLFNFSDSFGKKVGLLALVDITKQKKAEDAKSEFVSLASHQLRTPIAGMRWSAELLLMDNPESLTKNQSKYIDRLILSINRMAVLVDDFLRVSRFELGTFQAEHKSVDLSDLFKDIMSEQVLRVKQKDLSVKTFFDKSIDAVLTDRNLMRMIVTNLYSNAIKYTRNKGAVHIGFGRKDGSMIITVADNGMGIPAEDQDDIFSKLFRASNAVRDVPDGTGLGLYIVKEAVSVLGGSVTFTTTENIGTTFEVTLPLDLPENNLT